MSVIVAKTSCGKVLSVGDSVKLGSNGTTKIPGHAIGIVIQRRNKKTGFTTHRAGPLGELWIKYGRRKDNTEKILALDPRLLEFVAKMRKKGVGNAGRGKVNKAAEIENLDLSGITF